MQLLTMVEVEISLFRKNLLDTDELCSAFCLFNKKIF